MSLDLSALQSSISSLEKAIASLDKALNHLDEDTVKTIKSGVVQCFEVCYEQSWKMIKRWLESNISPDEGDGISRRELYRRAFENQLINSVDTWMEFHIARNLTSHTYNESAAKSVIEKALPFCLASKDLLIQIESRND